MQEYEPDMSALSLMVTRHEDLSQQPYGFTLAAGVLHDQYAHSLFCAHWTAHSCQVLCVSWGFFLPIRYFYWLTLSCRPSLCRGRCSRGPPWGTWGQARPPWSRGSRGPRLGWGARRLGGASSWSLASYQGWEKCHLTTCLCFVLLFTDAGHFYRIKRDNSKKSYLLSFVL